MQQVEFKISEGEITVATSKSSNEGYRCTVTVPNQSHKHLMQFQLGASFDAKEMSDLFLCANTALEIIEFLKNDDLEREYAKDEGPEAHSQHLSIPHRDMLSGSAVAVLTMIQEKLCKKFSEDHRLDGSPHTH